MFKHNNPINFNDKRIVQKGQEKQKEEKGKTNVKGERGKKGCQARPWQKREEREEKTDMEPGKKRLRQRKRAREREGDIIYTPAMARFPVKGSESLLLPRDDGSFRPCQLHYFTLCANQMPHGSVSENGSRCFVPMC